MNTWPRGFREPLSQIVHEKWNENNYPGTRQICTHCGEPTERCEEDSIYNNEDQIICLECYKMGNSYPICGLSRDHEHQM